MKKPSLLGALGALAVIAIVVASLIVRSAPPADPAADAGEQRAAVEHFHDLVRAGRWNEVYALTADPPGNTAGAFIDLMREQVREHGSVTDITAGEIRLVRARPSPLLEVHETVTIDGRQHRTVSYYTRATDGPDRWLFAFSAPER